MAIKPSGTPLSLSEIQTEFGGTNPISLSEYYRGGGLVPDGPSQNANIATSGAINMGGFYGAVNRTTINITISTNTADYVLNTAKAAGYLAGITDVVLNIDSGIYVYASGTGAPALDVDTSWAAGDTVRINNNGGYIAGMGGAGGNGESSNSSVSGFTTSGLTGGASGGLAFRAQRPVSFNNAGTIAGGGGGGGGGGADGQASAEQSGRRSSGGGGGGGGRTGLTNSGGGAGGTSSRSRPGAAGGAGTNAGGGGGGAGGNDSGFIGGTGGSGGGWGAGGGTGGTSATAGRGGAGGGAAGAAVAGNGNITWVATGTRLGAIS